MTENFENLLSNATKSMEHSIIREILKLTKGVPGMISLAGGLPSPLSFPREQLSELFSEVILKEGDDVLQYGQSEGDKILKKAIREFEDAKYLEDDDMVITDGVSNAIYLYTRVMINPGEIIVCEAPTFPGSVVTMEGCEATLVGVEMDELGMIPDKLEETLKKLKKENKIVKYLYLIPEFQNPTGRTMDLQRRKDILKIAIDFNLQIFEDQPYRDIRFSGEKTKTIWELARTEFNKPELVTLAKSFSKILGPGLRLGFAVGPKPIIAAMVLWLQKVIVSPECVAQRVAAKFITNGYMRPQINKIIDLYRPKRDKMIEALKKYMPKNVTWTVPDGGMFLWLTVPGIDSDKLFKKAVENKVAFVPGSNFYPKGIKRTDEIRLNFSYADLDQIEEGVRRFAELF